VIVGLLGFDRFSGQITCANPTNRIADSKQLTKFTADENIVDFTWSADGSALLLIRGMEQLILLSLVISNKITRPAPTGLSPLAFLNLEKPYPKQIFTIVICGNNRTKFGSPEVELKGKDVCVTGEITEYPVRGVVSMGRRNTSSTPKCKSFNGGMRL